jgi:hypothetical protein
MKRKKKLLKQTAFTVGTAGGHKIKIFAEINRQNG